MLGQLPAAAAAAAAARRKVEGGGAGVWGQERPPVSSLFRAVTYGAAAGPLPGLGQVLPANWGVGYAAGE